MRIHCFAGPNGSGKTTTFENHIRANGLDNVGFINADIFAKNLFIHIEDYNERNLKAAQYAEALRHKFLANQEDFAFETVMSTRRNLDFLHLAKEQGAEIDTTYVLTRDKNINVSRVAKRVSQGGHDVEEQKIRDRYDKCMKLLPELIDLSDTVTIYDNSAENKRIKLLLRKEQGVITVFSENYYADNFLHKNIVKPLETDFGTCINYLYNKPLSTRINVYSTSELEGKYLKENSKELDGEIS